MLGGMLAQPGAVPTPSAAPQMPEFGAGERGRSLIWLGAIVALVGAVVAAVMVGAEWTLARNVSSGTPQAALYEGFLYTYLGSAAAVGVGIFLAALGLAQRGPRKNVWFVLGGAMVLIGSVGSAAVSIYVQSLFFGGQFPGIDTIMSLDMLNSAIGLLYPLGLGILLFGFVVPRGATWNG